MATLPEAAVQLAGKLTRIGKRVRRTWRSVRTRYRHWARPNIIIHHDVRLPITDAVSEQMRAVLYAARYEEREYEVLTRLLTPSDRVLEIGAGLGFITVVCAKKCGSSRVTTVEANPQMTATLQRTFHENGVAPELRHGAVTRAGAEQAFFVGRDFWSSSTVDRGGERIVVPGLAFEALVEQCRPTIVVMDIEGGEVDLVGAKVGASVRAIVVELHLAVTGEAGTSSVRRWLTSEGFSATRDWGDRSVVVFQRGDQ
jgi:FkbM family methyltransferase